MYKKSVQLYFAFTNHSIINLFCKKLTPRVMNDTLFAAEFAKELEAEVPSTLKCLERIPLELSSWKPHEKSMEFGYLALLVAEIPLWITHIIKH